MSRAASATASSAFTILVTVWCACGEEACIRDGEGRITLEPPQLSLGTAIAGQTLDGRFTLRNVGAGRLVIDSIEGDCACLATLRSRPVVPPNGEVSIDFQLNTSDLRGKSRRRIRVYSNDRTRPVATAEIDVSVQRQFDVAPGLLDFGVVPFGTAVARSFAVNVSSPQLRLTGVRSTSPAVTAVVVTDGVPRNSASNLVQVTTAAAEPGSFFGVVVVSTNSPLNPELRVPVFGIISRELDVSEAR